MFDVLLYAVGVLKENNITFTLEVFLVVIRM